MLFNRNNISLLQVGFIPLIVEVKNHRNDFQRLIEKRVVGSRQDQGMEVTIQLGKQSIIVADGVAQLAMAV
ncbi:hypothetical protein D3C77_781210 [compost metagenome]